ncbi:MAG: hypothetical protein QXT77_07920 [Candidatus Methanomethylicaceae archaeon]
MRKKLRLTQKALYLNHAFIFREGMEDELCIPLTRGQATALLSLVEPLRWKRRWVDAEAWNQDDMDAWVSDLQYRLMSRCGGESVDCCDQIIQITNSININLTSINNFQRVTVYDGSPSSVHPEAPTTTFADSVDRRTALCLAIQRYIGSQAYAAMMQRCSADAIAAILATAGGLLIGGPLGAIAGGIVVGAAIADCAGWQALFEDDAALKDTACKLYQALNGLAVSQANFETALSSLTGSALDGLIAQGAGELTNYLYFLDLLGAGYVQALAGAEADCCPLRDCEPQEWDFTVSAYDWLITKGELVLGTGIRSVRNDADNGWQLIMEIQWNEPCFNGSNGWIDWTYNSYNTGGGPAHRIDFMQAVDRTWFIGSTWGAHDGMKNECKLIPQEVRLNNGGLVGLRVVVNKPDPPQSIFDIGLIRIKPTPC